MEVNLEPRQRLVTRQAGKRRSFEWRASGTSLMDVNAPKQSQTLSLTVRHVDILGGNFRLSRWTAIPSFVTDLRTEAATSEARRWLRNGGEDERRHRFRDRVRIEDRGSPSSR